MRYFAPYDDLAQYWIEVPAHFYGSHGLIAERLRESMKDVQSWMVDFTIALALLEDHSLPLDPDPQKWDFANLDLRLISWVSKVVLEHYASHLRVPKNSYEPSQTGVTAKARKSRAGTSKKERQP